MEDKHPDRIFVKDNLTSAEKLLFALREIKDLKQEVSDREKQIGALISEISHLNHRLAEIPFIRERSKVENMEIRKDERVKKLQEQSKELNKLVVRLRKDNADLINKLVSK